MDHIEDVKRAIELKTKGLFKVGSSYESGDSQEPV